MSKPGYSDLRQDEKEHVLHSFFQNIFPSVFPFCKNQKEATQFFQDLASSITEKKSFFSDLIETLPNITSPQITTPQIVQPQKITKNSKSEIIQKKEELTSCKKSENGKRVKIDISNDNKVRLFSDLPPNIIISEILTYLFHNSNTVKNDGNSLVGYGYFAKDPSRHIYMLFSHIVVTSSNNSKLFVFNIRKVLSITMVGIVPRVLRLRKFEFLKLVKIEFINVITMMNEVVLSAVDEFLCYNIFKVLKEIELTNLGSSSNNVSFGKKLYNAKKLRTLKLNMLGGSAFSLDNFEANSFYKFQLFNNSTELLTVLFLNGICFENSSHWSNFFNLNTLCLNKCNVKDSFFQNQSLKKLRILSLEDCILVRFEKWKMDFECLLIISVQNNSFVSDFFFSYECMKGLQKIKFQNCGSALKGNNWTKMKDLKVISICSCENFSDTFFSQQELSKLKVLSIEMENGLNIEGKGWGNDMSNLKTLLLKCPSLKDDLFIDIEMPNLTALVLENIPHITGKKWKPLKNLLTFACVNNEKFGDEFFQKNDLIERMDIYNVLATGNNWKQLENLCHFTVQNCKYFGDYFFQQQELKKLKLLSIVNVPLIKNKNWIIEKRAKSKFTSTIKGYFDRIVKFIEIFPIVKELERFRILSITDFTLNIKCDKPNFINEVNTFYENVNKQVFDIHGNIMKLFTTFYYVLQKHEGEDIDIDLDMIRFQFRSSFRKIILYTRNNSNISNVGKQNLDDIISEFNKEDHAYFEKNSMNIN